jgi:hypothetical protein
MSFWTLNEATARRRAEREALRTSTLERARAVLDRLAPKYGITEAYLFGSVVKPGRFSERSDVDVAAAGLGENFWTFAAEFSRALVREVDVVDLPRSRFAHRIRREGLRWTPNG